MRFYIKLHHWLHQQKAQMYHVVVWQRCNMRSITDLIFNISIVTANKILFATFRKHSASPEDECTAVHLRTKARRFTWGRKHCAFVLRWSAVLSKICEEYFVCSNDRNVQNHGSDISHKCTILINTAIKEHLRHVSKQVYHLQGEENASSGKQLRLESCCFF